VERNKGRTGAGLAPYEIRKVFYRFPYTEELTKNNIADIGDVKIESSLEKTHDNLFKVVSYCINLRKKIIVLGGGNDISYPDCRALAEHFQNVMALNIDRHLDVRSDQQINSGNPYRKLLEESIISPLLFHEIGINTFANSPAHIHYLEKMGAHIHYLSEVREKGVKGLIKEILASTEYNAIFFGFDLDAVKVTEAPGVSAITTPIGLSAEDVCKIADLAGAHPQTHIIEISEVNPTQDINNTTSSLAANIIMRALTAGY